MSRISLKPVLLLRIKQFQKFYNLKTTQQTIEFLINSFDEMQEGLQQRDEIIKKLAENNHDPHHTTECGTN